jgi:hypothetical protein
MTGSLTEIIQRKVGRKGISNKLLFIYGPD